FHGASRYPPPPAPCAAWAPPPRWPGIYPNAASSPARGPGRTRPAPHPGQPASNRRTAGPGQAPLLPWPRTAQTPDGPDARLAWATAARSARDAAPPRAAFLLRRLPRILPQRAPLLLPDGGGGKGYEVRDERAICL